MSELLTTARPYAKAFFESAKEKNMLDAYLDMLKNLEAVSSEISIKKNPYYGINVSKKIYLKLKNLDLSKKNYKIFYDIKI